jgi:hypothetical protein
VTLAAEVTDGTARLVGLELLVGGVLFATLGWALVWGILRAARGAAPSMVVTAVSVLTFTSIVGFVLTQSEVLGTVVATGIGALASAVTNLFDDGTVREVRALRRRAAAEAREYGAEVTRGEDDDRRDE